MQFGARYVRSSHGARYCRLMACCHFASARFTNLRSPLTSCAPCWSCALVTALGTLVDKLSNNAPHESAQMGATKTGESLRFFKGGIEESRLSLAIKCGGECCVRNLIGS